MQDKKLHSEMPQAEWNLSDESHNRVLISVLNVYKPKHSHAWRPPTDLYETEDDLVVRVEISGMKPTDFHVTLVRQRLSVSGVRLDVGDQRAYHQMEISFGEFNSEIDLPHPVDFERVSAFYQDGFLRVTLPKLKPHKVKLEP